MNPSDTPSNSSSDNQPVPPNSTSPDRSPQTKPPIDAQVPDDFPRELDLAALSGMQPKVSARLIEGRYVVGMTPVERLAQYLMCQDLVEQLLAYHQKHQQDDPPMDVEELVIRFYGTARRHQWPTTVLENLWIEKQLRAKLAPPH
jgi:hypothetical protein